MNYVFPFFRRRNRMGWGNENDMGCVELWSGRCAYNSMLKHGRMCVPSAINDIGAEIWHFCNKKWNRSICPPSLSPFLSFASRYGLWAIAGYANWTQIESSAFQLNSTAKLIQINGNSIRHCIHSIDVMLWWPMKLILFSISNYNSCNSSSEWNDTTRNGTHSNVSAEILLPHRPSAQSMPGLVLIWFYWLHIIMLITFCVHQCVCTTVRHCGVVVGNTFCAQRYIVTIRFASIWLIYEFKLTIWMTLAHTNQIRIPYAPQLVCSRELQWLVTDYSIYCLVS